MTTYLTSRNIALIAAGGFLAAVSLSGVAQAITDTVFEYATPQTGYLSIHAMGFTPADKVAADNYFADLNGIHSSFASGGICFHAPVYLPNGAKIVSSTIWYKGSGSNVLYRNQLSNGSSSIVIGTGFNVTSGNRVFAKTAADPSFEIVDNLRFTYSFELCLSDTTSLFSAARITYRYTNAGD